MNQDQPASLPSSHPTARAVIAAVGRFLRDDLVVPAVWFLLLAGFCAATGLVVGTGSWLSLPAFRYILLYLLILLPVFINRQTLYEAADIQQLQRDNITRWYKYIAALALLLPPLMLLALLSLALPYIFGRLLATTMSSQAFTAGTSLTEPFPQPRAIAAIMVAIVPMYTYAASITKRWPEPHFATFRYRSLLPALMTILLSFTLGWSLSHGPMAVVIAALVVLMFWLYIELARPHNFRLAITGTVFVITSALVVGAANAFAWLSPEHIATVQVVVLGLLVAACMIVCEGWRAAVKTSEWGAAEAVTYMAGASMATCIVLPVFLLTYALHGSTTILYAVLSLTLVLVLMGTWLAPSLKGRTYSRWVGVCVGGGLLVPATVGFTVRIPGASQSSGWSGLATAGLALGVFVSGILGVIAIGRRERRECLAALLKRDVAAFGAPRRAWALATLVSTTCMGLSAGIAVLAGFIGDAGGGSSAAASFVAQRCAVVSTLYVFLLIVSLIASRLTIGGDGEQVR